MSALPEGEAQGGRVSRRTLLGSGAAGATAVALAQAGDAEAASRRYPKRRVVALSKLRVNRPVTFAYPLKAQPNVLLDLGHAVPARRRAEEAASWRTASSASTWAARSSTGARPASSSVPAIRRSTTRSGSASIIQGVALRPLPRDPARRSRDGAVWAVGVDGLIYGYRTNLTPGKRVGGGS